MFLVGATYSANRYVIYHKCLHSNLQPQYDVISRAGDAQLRPRTPYGQELNWRCIVSLGVKVELAEAKKGWKDSNPSNDIASMAWEIQG